MPVLVVPYTSSAGAKTADDVELDNAAADAHGFVADVPLRAKAHGLLV